jgi:predicted nucleic acid-binding protein
VQFPKIIPETIAQDADLDAGESQAIALAIEIHPPSILIDESHGRAGSVVKRRSVSR